MPSELRLLLMNSAPRRAASAYGIGVGSPYGSDERTSRPITVSQNVAFAVR
ncbi:hypothetical protein ACFQZ4_21835 [Catellatospora coxensis]